MLDGHAMAKKRKTRGGKGEGDEPDKLKPPPKVVTGLGGLLKSAGITKVAPPAKAPARGPRTLPPPYPEPLAPVRHAAPPPKPQSPLSGTELRELNDAYAGVRRLGGSGKRKSLPYREVAPPTQHAERQALASQDDAAARARLAELVGGGVRFKITREDEFVKGLREGVSAKVLSRVGGRGFAPEATLDLHGLRQAAVGDAIAQFVRTQQRKGFRHLLVVTGKGLHSESGVSALRGAAVQALTSGGAAPIVAAFCTAHPDHGGSGALCVLLDG